MKRETLNTMTKLAAVLVIAAVDAAAEERRQAQQRIVISIPDRKLELLDGDRVVKTYDVAVGKISSPTPEGEFQIINHIQNPTYYGTGVVIGPGSGNPLGTRWMGLSAKGYGIHGTNVPNSIGKAASHGCIRMRQQDLEELFDLVKVGTTVELRGARRDLLAQILATPSAN
jgi:lipoprotein-anchoring transpeptidase ErfK/SrfK